MDCYHKKVKPYGFLEYAAFVSFFPQLVAGPIVLHSELIPQFLDEKKKKVDYANLTKGMYIFVLGLSKKVLIADTLSMVVHWGFANYMRIDASNTLLSMVCFTLQLYFDFSGYCDMARGIGYMFNVQLPSNFLSPYKATSIGEFWKRWHMTLTRFFTQYLYIPLGGNQKGKVRMYCNIFIVFLVSGFWHGADWNYVMWGLLNGICIILYRLTKDYIPKIPKAICVAGTFILTNFLFCFFKVALVRYGFEMIWNVFTGSWGSIESGICKLINETTEIRIISRFGLESLINQYPGMPLLILVAGCLVGVLFMKNTEEKTEVFHPTVWKMITFSILLTWSVVSLGEVSEFLYFNF
ncbi:MAG: MBOAT family O-acyltransferase [Eubacteriales bacterium]